MAQANQDIHASAQPLRARWRANPAPTTTVAPDLAEAMDRLRETIERTERMRYARVICMGTRGLPTARFEKAARELQIELESALEDIELLIAGGRR